MQAKDRIHSFLDAFSHAARITDFYEGACHGFKIALASIEMEEKEHEQARENNHKGNLWDTKSSHETRLRADEKREERRSQKMEQVSRYSISRRNGRG